MLTKNARGVIIHKKPHRRKNVKIYKNICELIGNTPLLELENYEKYNGLSAKILAKLEYFNPAGSAKDRIAKAMIDRAEKDGLLNGGSVIIEPTSGNTGIGLASVAAARGYRIILTMPETMSMERRNLLKAYGAELVLTDGALGMSGAIAKANELARQIDGSFIPNQFENPSNPEAHYNTTGPEIWRDTDGKVDIFVAGVGTGGTVSGAGRYLREKSNDIKIFAAEPEGSAVLSGESAGAHKLQGIGAGFIPKTLDTDIYDGVMKISAEDAYEACKKIAKSEGLLIGISSGAALVCATRLATLSENEGKNIVVIFPDSGERYLSTEGFI